MVQSHLDANDVTNVVVNADGSIPPVTLDSPTAEGFYGELSAHPTDPSILRASVTGTSRTTSRTITVDFHVEPYRFPVFNYGIATKGALRFPQNPTLTGSSLNWEADIYVESTDNLLAVQSEETRISTAISTSAIPWQPWISRATCKSQVTPARPPLTTT